MSWTISQVKNGGWRTDARFVEVAAYDGAVVERDALQARLDEAVALLRRVVNPFNDHQAVTAIPDSNAFLASINRNGGA